MAGRKSIFNWQLLMGFILVVTGGLYLVDQFLDLELMRNYWPFLVVFLGLTFFIWMILAGKRGAGYAIPGAFFTIAGLIFYVHNTYDLWITWTYAWGLMISAVGIGMLIMNIYLKRDGLRKAAGWVIGIGLILFVIFGIFFEVILDLAGANINSGIFLGGGLVLLGLFVVFSRFIFADRRKKPVMEEKVPEPAEKVVEEAPVDQAQTEESAEAPEIPVEPVLTAEFEQEFSKIDFKGAGEVNILHGDSCALDIQGDQELVEKVKTEISDGMLTITFKTDENVWRGLNEVGEESRLRYDIKVKSLEALKLDGAGSIHSDALTGESLKIQHDGLGKVVLTNLAYENLDVDLGGLGEIEVEGEVQKQSVHIGGAGAYKAALLKSQEAEVVVNGAGMVKVWVETNLVASLTGAGSIKYKGAPVLEESKTGLGTIAPIGE
ncbi:MAG: head GIN domain-containing protein [Brevefilum sp.]|nr:head GIN domain-containing protein [Brevefilum sp.]MDW7755141.1 head GIN domain-containing protein [Brevefilum sp.]